MSGLVSVVILLLAFVVKPKANGLNQTHETVVEGENVEERECPFNLITSIDLNLL